MAGSMQAADQAELEARAEEAGGLIQGDPSEHAHAASASSHTVTASEKDGQPEKRELSPTSGHGVAAGPGADTEAAKPIGPTFPDGGLRAWLVVLGSWMATGVSFGYISAFGVYQSYYETHQLSNETASNIAWVGSLQLFFIFFSAVFVGYLFDAGYHFQIFGTGSALLLIGVFTTAESTKLWQFVLAQGVCGGIGAGLIFLPATAALAHYFAKRRALVFGITATGSSTGGVIFPILLNRLFGQVGFKWGVRVAGFVILACLIVGNLCIKPRLPPRKRGSLIEPRFLKDPAYALFIAATSLIMLGLYTPIFYISSYAIAKGVDVNLAFYILSILNATSILGRVVPNIFANKVGSQNILYAASSLAALLNFVWIATDSAGGIIAFACFYGMASGSYVSTLPSCLANMTTNMNEIGSRTSLCFGIIAFAALCGTPITGALMGINGSFTPAACFSGAVILCGVGCGLLGRRILAKRKGTWKI